MANVFDQLLVEPSPATWRLLWCVLSLGKVSRDEPETHVSRDKPGMFLTLLHLFGFDHERLTYRHHGLDARLTDVAGKLVTKVLA